MAYTVISSNQKELSWDNSLQGDSATAKILNTEVTELTILNPDGLNTVITTNKDTLTYIRDVLTDLLNELAGGGA